jgi:hypothetical protein
MTKNNELVNVNEAYRDFQCKAIERFLKLSVFPSWEETTYLVSSTPIRLHRVENDIEGIFNNVFDLDQPISYNKARFLEWMDKNATLLQGDYHRLFFLWSNSTIKLYGVEPTSKGVIIKTDTERLGWAFLTMLFDLVKFELRPKWTKDYAKWESEGLFDKLRNFELISPQHSPIGVGVKPYKNGKVVLTNTSSDMVDLLTMLYNFRNSWTIDYKGLKYPVSKKHIRLGEYELKHKFYKSEVSLVYEPIES